MGRDWAFVRVYTWQPTAVHNTSKRICIFARYSVRREKAHDDLHGVAPPIVNI